MKVPQGLCIGSKFIRPKHNPIGIEYWPQKYLKIILKPDIMANTYTQIHLQLIFAVKYRRYLIEKSWKDELYKYITGIIQSEKHKLLIINGVEDHIHILIGFRPHQALSDLLQIIKKRSSTWINDRHFINSKFAWQGGYSAFSYSQSHLKKVIKYIENQEEHHKKKPFVVEYQSYLKAFEVEFDERYILKEPE